MSLVTRFYGPDAKGSKLTIKEMDDNLYYLQSLGVSEISFENDVLTLTNPTGGTQSVNINRYNKWHIPYGQTYVVENNYQSFIYGDIVIEGTLDLEENGQLVVLNGDIILSGGTIVGSGATYLIDLPEYNTFVTDGTFDSNTKQITFTGNYGFSAFTVDLSTLSTDNFYTTGGTYNSITESIDFSGNSSESSFSVDVSQLLDDTNSYTTGGTYNPITESIDFSGNTLDTTFSVNVSQLLDDTNSYTTGGTYNSLTESIDFVGNTVETTFSVDVSQLLDDTNTYTTGATLNGTVVEFNRNDISNAYSVDLSPLDVNLYNSDGSLPGDRFVTLDGGFLFLQRPQGVTEFSANGIYISAGSFEDASLTLNSSINYERAIKLSSGGFDRWQIKTINNEIGSNNGADLVFESYNDLGVPIRNIIRLVRSGETIVNSNLSVNGNSVFSGSSTDVVKIYGSGTTSPLFSVQGSSGELFSISDNLIGSLFSVNDISGLPVIEAFSDNTILMGSFISPSLNTTVKKTLTSGDNVIYSIPTSAYTGAFFDYTLISSTGARAGNVMAIWSGSSSQYTDVSTNDIGSTSGVSFSVTVSGTSAIFSSSATTSEWTLKTIVRSI